MSEKKKKDNRYILAMYDIRGKQDYIYKSNKMKEIIGASYIIRDCFEDYLYPAAKACSRKGIYNYKAAAGNTEFTREGFKRHLEEGYLGEVIYDGGGNFFVLYQDIDSYRKVNRLFFRKVLEGTYSLRVLSSYIEGVDFDDYQADRSQLYSEVHSKDEQQESMLHSVNTFPFTQVDYRSYLPLSAKQKVGNHELKVSYESKMKYRKYEQVMRERREDRIIAGDKILDDMITEKGEESLLAVIYIDGNNMGAQVERCLNPSRQDGGSGTKSYEDSVRKLREFSSYIQENYIDNRIKDVDAVLEKFPNQKRRFAIYAGDEITFICNARAAYAVAVEYLKKLSEGEPADAPRTSCAGIAIFHSHAPYADAYRIAEECCESGKQLMKRENIQNASLIDFHYCQGAIGTSLEDIREQEEMGDAISRPWMIRCQGEAGDKLVHGKLITGNIVEDMRRQLELSGRSNIKKLLFSARRGKADFEQELNRIIAHQSGKKIDFTLGGRLTDPDQIRGLVYDMVLVYDLWFDQKRKEGTQKDGQ